MNYRSKRPASSKIARKVGVVATTLALVGTSAPAVGLLSAVPTVALADGDEMKPGLYVGDDNTGVETLQATGEVPLFDVEDPTNYMYYASEDGKTEFGINLFTKIPESVKAYYDADAKTLNVVQADEKANVIIDTEFKVWKDRPGGDIEKVTKISQPMSLEELKSIDDKRCSLDIYVYEVRVGLYLDTEDGQSTLLESGELPMSDDKQWVNYFTADGGQFGIRFEEGVKAVYDAEAGTVTFSPKNAGEKVKVERTVSVREADLPPVETEKLSTTIKLDEIKTPTDDQYWCDVRADIDHAGLSLHTFIDGGEDTYQLLESGELPGLEEDQNIEYWFENGKHFNIGYDDAQVKAVYDEDAGTVVFTTLPGWKMVAHWRANAWQTGKILEEKDLASGDGEVTLKLNEVEGLDDDAISSDVEIRSNDLSFDPGAFWFDDAEAAKPTEGVEWAVRDDGTMYAKVKGQDYTGWITYGTTTYFNHATGEEREVPARRYLKDGVPVVGKQTIDGADYVFEDRAYEDGIPGLLCVDDTPGEKDPETGAVSFYKTDGMGRVVKNQAIGLTIQDGIRAAYYTGADGKRVTGWQQINGHTYYFDPKVEEMQTMIGVQKLQMAYAFTGKHTIDGKEYDFGKDGRLVGDSPATPDTPSIPEVPAEDPQAAAGKDLLNKWTSTGHAASDFQHWDDLGDGTLEGALWACYDAEGKLVTDRWINYTNWTGTEYRIHDKDWYYLGSDGAMVVGKAKLKFGSSEEWYYMNPNHDGTYGKMYTGWLKVANGSDTDWYYCDPRQGSGTYGKLMTGWQTIDGATYFFYNDESNVEQFGKMAKNTTIDGKKLGGDGKLIA